MVLNPIKAIASRLSPSSTHNGPTSAPSSNSRSPRNPVPAAAPVTHRGRQYSAVGTDRAVNAYKTLPFPDAVVFHCSGKRSDIEASILKGVSAFQKRQIVDATNHLYEAGVKSLMHSQANQSSDPTAYLFAFVAKECVNRVALLVVQNKLSPSSEFNKNLNQVQSDIQKVTRAHGDTDPIKWIR